MMCGVLYFQQESQPLTVHTSFILFGNNFTVYATRFTFILFIFSSCYKIHGGNLWSMDVRILLHLLLPLLLHRHRTDHLLLSREHQQKVLKFRTYCRIISRRQVSLQLLPENNCFFTFLFSFCFFFFSLTISRSSIVSSKESPDFVACGGNGSFTTTWQRNVKSNTTAFDNRFTALLISVIFGNFRLLSVVFSKYWQH